MKRLIKYGELKITSNYTEKEEVLNFAVLKPNRELNDNKKYRLIKLFFDSYYNTDQDVELFSNEYYLVMECILNRKIIPLELRYLNVESIYEDLIEILKEGV